MHSIIHRVERIVQRLATSPATKQIDQLVSRDRMHPGTDRNLAGIGAAMQVQGQERFLNQILDLVQRAGQATSKENSQADCDECKRRSIGRFVPALRKRPERLQSRFKRVALRHLLHFVATDELVTAVAEYLAKF